MLAYCCMFFRGSSPTALRLDGLLASSMRSIGASERWEHVSNVIDEDAAGVRGGWTDDREGTALKSLRTRITATVTIQSNTPMMTNVIGTRTV